MAVARINGKRVVWFSVGQTVDDEEDKDEQLPQVDTEAYNDLTLSQ